MGVDKDTVHLLRLKVIDSFEKIRKNVRLQGKIEAYEKYFSINLKGTKPEKMPRFSKKRASKGTTTRGINGHKICVISAIDEYDNNFLEIVGTGPVTSKMVEKSLTPRIEKLKVIITDCKSSYESEAKKNNWILKQVKSELHCDLEGNNLANINSLHSGLTTFLSPFRGISSKHLQGYLDWYSFHKYLNYCFEYDKQKDKLFNHTMIEGTQINRVNAYDNYSGIDFYDVYSDYNFTPS